VLENISSADEMFALCEESWDIDADLGMLTKFAQSSYGLGDLGWGEDDDLTNGGIEELFDSGHGQIYKVLGDERQSFGPGFPLFRVVAAAHPRTPDDVLAELAKDDDPEVLWAVAGNPNAGDALLVAIIDRKPRPLIDHLQEVNDPELDNSSNSGIRYGDGNIWERPDVPVLVSAAGNRSCGADLLDRFCGAGSADVAKALLLRNSDRLSEENWRQLLEGTRGRDRDSNPQGWLQWIAMSPHLPLSHVDEILSDPTEGPILARRLARTPNIPEATLRQLLSNGTDEWTRSRIAGHPSATTEMLRELAMDPSGAVRTAVIANSSASDEIRALAAISN
jgi:hypothetical protein